MKLKLESVRATYNAYDDRIHVVEHYVPCADDEEGLEPGELYVHGTCEYATRRIKLTDPDWQISKRLLQIQGVKIIDVKGDEIP